jgi:hypothetical protein
MANLYNRGQTFLKYLNVLRPSSTVPVFPTDYTTPTYTIYFKNGAFSTTVSATGMTQGLDNIWYFSHFVQNEADFGTYLIKYKTTIDGIDIETTEDFIVTAIDIDSGTGEFEIIDTVQSDTMDDLSGVDVYIFLLSAPDTAIAHATTDTNGQFIVYLDEGTYRVLFSKTNYIQETHDMTVDNTGAHVFTGN